MKLGVLEKDYYYHIYNRGINGVTIFENENDGVYASFDPYGNSGIAHEDDNWVIKAEQITINEL